MKTVAALFITSFLALQAHADFRYKVVTKTEGAQQGGPGGTSMQMTAAGDKARIDFTGGAPMGNDGYLLSHDGGKTMIMVSPKDKTYMTWDMNAMMGMAGAMTSMMKMEVTDPKVEKLLDEPGEPLLGYPTRHYKFRVSYGMSMTLMGFKNASNVTRDEETWTTTKIDTAALTRWIKQAPKTMNESLDKLIVMERDRMEGLPLKTLSVQTTTDKSGKAQTLKTTMEVTEVKTLDTEAGYYDIPTGFQEATLEVPEEADGEDGKAPAKSGKPNIPGFLKLLK